MPQERQIIGYKPDGTPVYGPPVGAPPLNANLAGLFAAQAPVVTPAGQANLAGLQPQAPVEEPVDPGLLEKGKQVAGWLIDQFANDFLGTAKRIGGAVANYELDKGRRLVDAAQRFNVNDAVGDVVQGVSDIPGEQWASAAQTFGEGLGLPHVPLTNQDGEPLSQNPYLQGAAMVGAMAVPMPGGKIAKVADKVGDAARALRGPAAKKFEVLRNTIGEERFDQLLYDWKEAYVDPDTGRLMTTLSDRFSEGGRQQPVPIAKQHFLDWVERKSPNEVGLSDESLSQFSPADRTQVEQLREEMQRILKGTPTPATAGPRGAEVAAAANAKLAASLGKTPTKLSHLDRAPVDIDDTGRMFVSTRVPTSKTGQVKADTPLSTGFDEVLRDPELVRTFAAKIRGDDGSPYNLLTDGQLRGTDEQVIRAFMDTGASNIRYMIDQMEKGGWAKFSREWYDGANTVTGRLARTYRVEPDASTGVVAVLSPQKDWHQNAEMAKRVIQNHFDFTRTNPKFDREVFNRYRVTSTKAKMESLKQQVRDGKITPVMAEWSLQDHAFYLDKYKKAVVGSQWQDLAPDDQAIYLRAYDELANGQRYPVLAPDGSVAHEFAINDSGEEAKMAWQSYGAIKKALSILDNPTRQNISEKLGNEHKVRAFFNNMSRPNWGRLPGQRGPSTVDTHQVAVSHLMPYGAASPVVKYTMGGASNSALGLSGMNPLYQEMLTEAVKGNPNDYLPRAGQSVSWDGIKSLFSPEQKRDKQFVAKIDGLWKEYQQGRMSLRGVQDAITNEAGGIKPPEWAKRK
jgi:hypothetical protein